MTEQNSEEPVHPTSGEPWDEWLQRQREKARAREKEITRLGAELDTRKHIAWVGKLLHLINKRMLDRASNHDRTKLEAPEAETFAIYTEKLNGMTYGSDDYKPCLQHHYAKNRHHPERFPNGVSGMTLIDLIEMLLDWKAASERHNDGNILKSIEHNSKRLNIGPELTEILVNTVGALGFAES